MSTVNVTINFMSLFLMNRMMLTITKQCEPQAGCSYQYHWQKWL